jgi:hypothetical protein
MKNLLKTSAAVAALVLATSAFAHVKNEPGYVDFGKFTAEKGETFVEVNVPSALIKFAAKVSARQEPEAAELLANIKHVRVNVFGTNDRNREETLARMNSVREELAGKGWERIVTAQDKGDDVAVFTKLNADETIEGLVVTVMDKGGEAVFVNVVGRIEAEQLAKLAENLDIEPLRKVKVKVSSKS